MTNEVKEAVDKLGQSHDKFVESSDRKLDDMGNRIDELESLSDRPKASVKRRSESDTERRYEGLGMMIKGIMNDDPETKEKGKLLLQGKAASGLSDLAGGSTIQEELGAEIFAEVRKLGGLFDLVRVTEISTAPSEYKRIVAGTNTNSGWVGEGGARTATLTPGFYVPDMTGGILYALPAISEELAASSAYNVGEFLIAEAGRDFHKQIATAIVSGSGTNRPTGLTQNAPVSTADDASPRRTFDVLQYLPTGDATGFQSEAYSQPSPLTDPLAVFWDALSALKSQYRANAKWVMNSNTLAALGKLRDTDGKSMFNPNISAAVPLSLFGYEIVIDEYVDDLGSNNFCAFFGDFSMGYELVSNFETRLTIDEISTKGQTAFYLRSFLGGCPTMAESIKCIKCSIA